jgi:hypothetical protein
MTRLVRGWKFIVGNERIVPTQFYKLFGVRDMNQSISKDPAEPKGLTVRWSSLAMATADHDLPAIGAKFLEDVRTFLPDARRSFSHIIPSCEYGVVYLFRGDEQRDVWDVTCQLATLGPASPLRDDPDQVSGGKVINFPTVINESSNLAFEAFSTCPGSKRVTKIK